MTCHRHRIDDGRPEATASACIGLCLGLLGLVACGDRAIAPDGEGGSTADSGSSDAPSPPDLGPDAVVCGEPGDVAATDEDIALLEGCQVFQGLVDLWYPNVTDLSPLASLRVIREGLSSGSNNLHLETLDGLERLEWVGKFSFNADGVRDFSGVENLRDVEDYFGINGMPNLADLHGLEQLRAVGGKLSLSGNAELTNLDGLSGLEWVGGELYISGNDKLASLDGLAALQEVSGDVTIRLNPQLSPAELDAFVNRIEIGGDVRLE